MKKYIALLFELTALIIIYLAAIELLLHFLYAIQL